MITIEDLNLLSLLIDPAILWQFFGFILSISLIIALAIRYYHQSHRHPPFKNLEIVFLVLWFSIAMLTTYFIIRYAQAL